MQISLKIQVIKAVLMTKFFLLKRTNNNYCNNYFLKSCTNFNVSEIAKDIINIALCCQSDNIARIFMIFTSIVYSTKVSHIA